MMEILLGSLVLLVGILVVVITSLRSGIRRQADARTDLLLQQQVESLRTDVRSSMEHLVDQVNGQLTAITGQIQSQTNSVGERLDGAARVIGDVQRHLGELGQATEEIKDLGKNVAQLEELLRSPKLRGGLGEFLLEDLLQQVLPAEHFRMQYRFRSGRIVDAAIFTSDRIVPVDSKFPLENFRKMAAAGAEGDRKSFRKAFLGDVRKHIDDIAASYILPEEGTFPFALMYIPAENIYYEVIIRDESENGAALYAHAVSRKVIPVSPNSFFAYLQVVALGLRGLRIEESAHQILNMLAGLQGDIRKVRETFETLGSHLDNARKKFDETDRRLSGVSGRLDLIAEQSHEEERPARLAPGTSP